LVTFEELGLSDPILKVLSELGFEKPTEIQERSIPKLMSGDVDMIGLAQTGTGKTAAFGLPLLDRIDPKEKFTQGLILAPTRELGKQIAEQLAIFSKYLDRVNVLAVYGGAPIHLQIRDLRRTQHVIIATPGRLIDLIKRKAVHLDQLKFLILDEADEMLNMGFKDELDKILSYTPEDKMTWLFSATMAGSIKKIVRKYMDNPVEVKVNARNEVNADIEHQFTTVRQRDKAEALTRFLDIHSNTRAVVFCRTKRDTQNLAEVLVRKNYKADALHGDLSQFQRDRVMKRFKANDINVLIATDVAARGIDVSDLSHVFHYDLPDDNAYYTHRSGRTGRAGKKGISISFLNVSETYRIKRLERELGIRFSKISIPSTADIAESRLEGWCIDTLQQKTNGRVDEELLEKISLIFGNLSKEELIAKVVASELEKLDLGGNRDLNDNSPPRRGSDRRHGGRRDYRGGGRRFSRGGGRDSRGGRDYRGRDSRGGRDSRDSRGDSRDGGRRSRSYNRDRY